MPQTSMETKEYKTARRVCAAHILTEFGFNDYISKSGLEKILRTPVPHKKSDLFREDVNTAYLNSLALRFEEGRLCRKDGGYLSDVYAAANNKSDWDGELYRLLEKYLPGDKWVQKGDNLKEVHKRDKEKAINFGYNHTWRSSLEQARDNFLAKVKQLEEKVRDLLEGKQEHLPATPSKLRTYGLPLASSLLTAALVLIPAAYWAGSKLKKTEHRIDMTERDVYNEINSIKSKIPDEKMIRKIIEPYVLKEKDIETGVKKGILAVIEEFGDDPSTILIAIMQAQKLKKEREKEKQETKKD